MSGHSTHHIPRKESTLCKINRPNPWRRSADTPHVGVTLRAALEGIKWDSDSCTEGERWDEVRSRGICSRKTSCLWGLPQWEREKGGRAVFPEKRSFAVIWIQIAVSSSLGFPGLLPITPVYRKLEDVENRWLQELSGDVPGHATLWTCAARGARQLCGNVTTPLSQGDA
jgi:hypothetical protein